MNNNKDYLQVFGKVIEVLGNSAFRVECDNGKIIITRITAEFRSRRKKGRSAKIIEGSKVKIKLSLNDLSKGDIVSFANE